MDGFVLDVSACMPWCCEDEATAASEELLQRAARREALHVPSLWPWEMMNAVSVSVRRQRVTPERARQFFEQLAPFDFHIAPAPSIGPFAELSLLASRYQLTAYDAAYLGLARQFTLPLAIVPYRRSLISPALHTDNQGQAPGRRFFTALAEAWVITAISARWHNPVSFST